MTDVVTDRDSIKLMIDGIGIKIDDVLDRVGKTQTEVKLLTQQTDQMTKTVERIDKTVFHGNGKPSVLELNAIHGEQLNDHEKQLEALFRKSDQHQERCSKLHAKRSYTPREMRAVNGQSRWRRPRTVVISGSAVLALASVVTWAIWAYMGGNGPPPPMPTIAQPK